MKLVRIEDTWNRRILVLQKPPVVPTEAVGALKHEAGKWISILVMKLSALYPQV